LVRTTGSYPNNVFDTQRAAGFIGQSSSISLCNLLKNVLGIHLSKTETRTNWLKRPLSKRQIEYALNDVRYLPRLRNIIIEKVGKNGFINWLFEEQKVYDNPDLYKDKDTYSRLQKIKGIKQLTSKELAILFELVDWREKEAQEINVPREHIIRDKTLILLSKFKSKKVKKINNSKDFTEKMNRLYGEKIIKAINKALNLPPDQWPEKSFTFHDDNTLNARIDFIVACIKGKCIANEIDPALIASRMEISEFVKGFHEKYSNSSQLSYGWRKEFIGDIIKKVLSGKRSVCLNPSTGLPQISNNAKSKK
jgi:ribonuclease D